MQASGSGTPHSNNRKVQFVAPISASTTLTSTGIDCRGWKNLDVSLMVGVMATNATIDCKLQESDTLGGSYADITGAAFVQKVAATDGALIYSADVNLTLRKRFIKVVCACATAASVVAVAGVLSNADSTVRVQAAQLASSPAATPLAALGTAGSAEFSV